MSLRRPGTPKIRSSVPKPRRVPRKISSTVKKPSIKRRTISINSSKTKKTKHSQRGICYECRGCKGKILFKRVSKIRCKQAGGKSWKGRLGCESL